VAVPTAPNSLTCRPMLVPNSLKASLHLNGWSKYPAAHKPSKLPRDTADTCRAQAEPLPWAC
jgi:hypothetical protein